MPVDAAVMDAVSTAAAGAAGRQDDDVLGHALLLIARHALADEFGIPHPRDPQGREIPLLDQPGASFVTLTSGGALRGCIGSLIAARALANDVRANALAAAFSDERFPALTPQEFESVRIEVSLLSPAEPLAFADEADALQQLRPGVDGLILEHGHHRATFLPQVWDSLPEPRQFLAHLKSKAGLASDFWDGKLRLSRYQVQKWQEP